MDGIDGNVSRFEKIGQFFSNCDAIASKNLQEIYYSWPSLIKFIQYLRRNFTEALCV